MTNIIVTKFLGAVQDLAFGRGKVSQTRGGKNFQLDKLSFTFIVGSEAQLNDLDYKQFPSAAVVDAGGNLAFYEWQPAPVSAYVRTRIQNPLVHRKASMALQTAATTAITAQDVPVRVVGTTVAAPGNTGFSHTSGRLTCTGEADLYSVAAAISLAPTTTQGFAIYLALNGSPIEQTKFAVVDSVANGPKVAVINHVLELRAGDFLELYIANTGGLDSLSALSYNLSVSD